MTSRKFFSDLLKYADHNPATQKYISMYERGLLTYTEASQEVIKLYTNRNSGEDDSVKTWYTASYPTDEAGQDIDENITFSELYHALRLDGSAFYEVIGAIDSTIRERIFEKLADIFCTSYASIYDLWLA